MPRTSAPRWDKANHCYRVTVNYKPYSLGSDYADACRRLAGILKDRQRGVIERPLLVSELIDAWRGKASDWKIYITNIWGSFEPETLLEDLGDNSLKDFARHLAKRKPHPDSTAAKAKQKGIGAQLQWHCLSHAIRCCRWGFERGYLETMPIIPKLPAIPDSPKDLDDDRLLAIVKKFERPGMERASSLFGFILAIGCRPSEARLLRWNEVRMNDRNPRIVLEPDRHRMGYLTGKPKIIHLHPEATDILRAVRRRDRRSKFVFLSRHRKPYTRDGFRLICTRAGCTPRQFDHGNRGNRLRAAVALAESLL